MACGDRPSIELRCWAAWTPAAEPVCFAGMLKKLAARMTKDSRRGERDVHTLPNRNPHGGG
jgi:hypothetical protein